MKKIGYYILIFFVSISCSTSSKLTKATDKSESKTVVLSDSDLRKFNYFFLEGQRFKMQGNYEKAKMYFVECLKVDASSSVSYYELANIEIALKNIDSAIQLLEKAVNINPNNKWYSMFLGDLYLNTKNTQGAVKIYKSLKQKYPDNINYIYTLANLYTEDKKYDLAIKEFNDLEDNIGIHEIITLAKDDLYRKLGKENLALKEINKLINEYPKEAKYYGFLGDFYMYYENFDKAEEAYNKIIEIDNKNGLGYLSLSNIYIKKGDTISYINYFNIALKDENLDLDIKVKRLMPILMNPELNLKSSGVTIDTLFNSLINTHNDDFRPYFYYANFLKSKQKTVEAYSLMKNAITIYNEDASMWQELLILSIDLGKYDELIKYSNEALTVFPDNSLFYLFNGMAHMQNKANLEAKESLLKALDNVGDNINLKAQISAYLGDVYYNLGDSENAFKHYEETLSIDENNVLVLNNYSYYLSLENKDLDKAEKMIAKCIELESGNHVYMDTYAWVLFKRGRYFEAKFIIEQAIDSGGDNSFEIVEHYGDILFKNGDVSGAVLNWKKSKELGNDSEVLLKKIELKEYVEE